MSEIQHCPWYVEEVLVMDCAVRGWVPCACGAGPHHHRERSQKVPRLVGRVALRSRGKAAGQVTLVSVELGLREVHLVEQNLVQEVGEALRFLLEAPARLAQGHLVFPDEVSDLSRNHGPAELQGRLPDDPS